MVSERKSLSHLSELLVETRLLLGEPADPALVELLEKIDVYRRAGHRVWVTKIEEARRGQPGLWDLDVDTDDDVCEEVDQLVEDFKELALDKARRA